MIKLANLECPTLKQSRYVLVEGGTKGPVRSEASKNVYYVLVSVFLRVNGRRERHCKCPSRRCEIPTLFLSAIGANGIKDNLDGFTCDFLDLG